MAAPVNDWGAPFAISLPPITNGHGEYGIAAGADTLTQDVAHLRVLTKIVEGDRTPAVPRPPLPKVLEDNRAAFDACTAAGKKGMPHRANLSVGPVKEYLGVASLDDIPENAVLGTYEATPLKEPEPVPDGKPDSEEIWLEGTMAVNKIATSDPVVTAWYAQAVVFLLSSGWIVGKRGNVNVTYLDPAESIQVFGEAAAAYIAKTAGAVWNTKEQVMLWTKAGRDPKDLGTQIISMKITWFQTNHHVGQRRGQIESYAGKVFRLDPQLAVADQETLRMRAWAIGKYCVTIPILASAGVPGLLDVTVGQHVDEPWRPVNFGVSEDVALRLTSSPAGTARTLTVLAILRHAQYSVYSVLIPGITDWDELNEAEDDIKAAPARYHMGSLFLTGLPRVVAHAPAEETRQAAAAYIHASAPGSQLAKANVILPPDEVRGQLVYTLITRTKADLAGMATDAVIKKLMNKQGGARGGFAHQVGRITDADVAEAEAAVKAEKEAEDKKAAGGGQAAAGTRSAV